jgi:hypothetical protein
LKDSSVGSNPTSSATILDSFVKAIIEKDMNMIVPHYLMSSYLYYHEDTQYISDGMFDWICSLLRDNWENISHFHKHLILKECLSAGTGFYLKKEDFPLRTIGAAFKIMQKDYYA